MKFTLPGAVAIVISAIVIVAVGQLTLLQQAKSQVVPASHEPAPLPIVQHDRAELAPHN